MMKNVALIILSISLLNSIQAEEFVLSQRVKEAQILMYELRLDEALEVIDAERIENDKNGFIPYLYFTHEFFKMFISENETYFNKNRDRIDGYIDEVKDLDDDSPWQKFCLSEMYLMRSSIEIKFENNWGAAWDGLKAYNLLKENAENFPEFEPQWVNQGVLNLALGSIPNNYKFMASFFGMEGNIDEGRKLIDKAWSSCQSKSEEYRFNKTAFIYGYAAHQLALTDLKDLRDLNVDPLESSLLIYVQVKLFQSQNRNSEILTLLENRKKGVQYFPFYYLDYLEGKSKLAALRNDANVPFEAYLRNYPGNHFIKASYGFLSWFYTIQGNAAKAAENKSLVFSEGRDFTGADQMAIHYMSSHENGELIKAHLSFDNGDFVKAKKLLRSCVNETESQDEKIEWHYLFGRIFQQENSLSSAINSFVLMLEVGSGKNESYYIANGSLQLAKIHEELGELEKAKSYYKSIFDLEDYPYEEGIQQQAKAGLKRVK